MISKMIFLFFSLFLFGMEVESKTLAGQVRYITYVEFSLITLNQAMVCLFETVTVVLRLCSFFCLEINLALTFY